LDKERRNNLRRVINQCRKILEADIEKRLIYYGIMADGAFLDLDELKHLKDEEIETRKRIELAIEKELVGRLSKQQAIERYIRHTAFTFLNRIAALRAMEVRSLVKETVIQRSEYGGRSLREREISEINPSLSPYEILKTALIHAFKEVSEEIKVLFDTNSEYSIIFPSEKACRDSVRLLTEDVMESDWKEDDIIGWVYQYFNDEARREFRKARRKPTPDDIPVINQFYTPHWIVKALVDNTLGRLWLEMHPNSKLKEYCTYLVPLKNGQSERDAKKVSEIKILDPACGSGHFLVYAFDVLYQMYQEDEPDTPSSEIPALILENNLHGIDIDLYSVQLAALSLFLKAKTHNPSLKIRKMNLVCADIRVSDGRRRLELLERFRDDPDLKRIFEKLFEDIGYTYEIGSLLKVRQPFERLFKERKHGERQAKFAHAISGQTELGRKGLTGQTRFLIEALNASKNLILVVPKERTIEEMLEELRVFERQAIEAHDMGRLLFATEAEKSVGLLALLSQKYDVVLMNPPYGIMPLNMKEYAIKNYPKTKNDYYATFIEQAIDLNEENGFVGMLTSRTFMFLKKFSKLREDILWNEGIPELVLDTGFGVLDGATVETAAIVLRKIRKIPEELPAEKRKCTFCKLTIFDTYEKEKVFTSSLSTCMVKGEHELWYTVTFSDLAQMPKTTYAYWASSHLRALFRNYPTLDRDLAGKPEAEKIADVKQGLATADDECFTRQFWEVPSESIGQGQRWVPFVRGGNMWYSNISLVVNWDRSGEEVKRYIVKRYPYLDGKWEWVVKNSNFYFRDGLSYPPAATGFSPRILVRYFPLGCIFGHKGISIFFQSNEALWSGLAVLNSKLIWFLLMLLTPSRCWEAGTVASLPWACKDPAQKILAESGREAHDLLREWDTGNETSTSFIKPWILQVIHGFDPSEKPITKHPLAKQFEWSDWPSAEERRSLKRSQETLLKLTELCVKQQLMLNRRIEEIQKDIDEEVYRIYEISDEDRALIERELALQKTASLEEESGEAVSEEIEESSKDVISSREHVERLISYYLKKAIESDEDGIVPLDEMFSDNLFSKIHVFILQDFGKERVDRIELEISEIFGKSLKRWIEEEYFDFHVRSYRRRPVFWQLTSSMLGQSKPPGVFLCFVHYHRLDRDTIPKILAFYLDPFKERLSRERDRVFKDLESARATGNRKRINELSKAYEEVLAKIDEIESMEKNLNILRNPREDKTKLKPDAKWFDKAIAGVRDNGWNPIIDYGVRVNIEPLKELKLLHPAANRVK
jgi:hypothetical protein